MSVFSYHVIGAVEYRQKLFCTHTTFGNFSHILSLSYTCTYLIDILCLASPRRRVRTTRNGKWNWD